MTVRELRQKLFDVKNQESQVLIVTPEDIRWGEISRTHQIVDGRSLGDADDEEGYVTIHTL